MINFINSIPTSIYIFASLGVIILGIILGYTRKITVFRNYQDVAKVFMLVLIPCGLLIILKYGQIPALQENKGTFQWFLGILEVLMLIWIFITTYKDNGNIFATILAFVTKIPLGIIFVFYLINLIGSGGRFSSGGRKSRTESAIVLMLLAPIFYALVRDRKWSSKPDQNE
ncbi:MAG: hypothetical protein NTW49_12125 [Bacteroidia bacterium]|nr:hypothetical protein [Bacteroidia bacterium]